MTTNQLLDQLQCLLSSYSPVVEKTRSPQVPPVQISMKDLQPQQSELPTIRKIHQPPSEGGRLSSPRNLPITDDKGVADRTSQNPQFFNQDEKPSSKAVGVRARCQTWLEARLNEGPVALLDVKKEAQQLGYGPKCLRVARKQLGVKPTACLALPADQHS